MMIRPSPVEASLGLLGISSFLQIKWFIWLRDMHELLIERGIDEVVDDWHGIVRMFGVKQEFYKSFKSNKASKATKR